MHVYINLFFRPSMHILHGIIHILHASINIRELEAYMNIWKETKFIVLS